MTKLVDLHEAGLVDMETYRTKPCLTWITTGSWYVVSWSVVCMSAQLVFTSNFCAGPSHSPFGKRCTGIHDHRVGSSASQSWLPHTETQGNTIATDINVDGLHQKRLHTILYDNPFGDQFTLTADENGKGGTWDDLYGLVCGDATDPAWRSKKDGWIAGGSSKRGRQVHPIYKLQIALKQRGTDSDWQYKYRPQHIVHEELCMVLQKRAFRVTSNDHTGASSARHISSTATSTSSVVEISLNAYNPRLANHILVHEIAFGPDSDPSVRGVALWFNIAESDVTVCTPQQAKRFRWKKTGNATATKRSSSASSDMEKATDGNNSKIKPSVFDSGTLESFPMIRPHDDAAFRLATDMMKHRLAFLKRERMSSMKDRFEALQKLQRQEQWLQERFENQRRMWIQWAWPVNIGREMVCNNTPVPPVEGPYLVHGPREKKEGQLGALQGYESMRENKDPTADIGQVQTGANVRRIWDSFVNTCLDHATEYPSAGYYNKVCF